MADDHVAGGWVQLIPRRERGQAGQTIRLSKPEADDRITWAQRPQYRQKMVRIRVLKPESGSFLKLDYGEVCDLPSEEAEPRLKDGRVRLARSDERLTNASE